MVGYMPQAEKILSWILKGGLLATPFIVFIVTRSLYFPFITGKNFAFRVLVELLAVVWVYAALRYASFRPRFSWLLAAVVAFIAVMGFAIVFSLSPYRSFWSNFERMEGYIGLLHVFLYFLLLVSVFSSERDWRTFFWTSVAASVLISLYGVLQLAGRLTIHQGGTRVDATLGNATYLAVYLLFHIFFLIWFLLRPAGNGGRIAPAFRENHVWLRGLLAAVILLELVMLYYTATRGAILGLFGGLFILAILLAIFCRGWLRRVALGGLGLVVLVPVVFFLVKDTAFVRSSEVLVRFATISPTETTTQARFTIWNMALRGWMERPILGWGQESFIYVFAKYYEPSLWRQEPWFDRAHNVFLDWLIAGGVLGLASYLAMFAAAGWLLIAAYRSRRLDAVSASVMASLLAAHFFQNLFVFDNLTSYLLFFSVLGFVHTIATTDRSDRPTRPPPAAAPHRRAFHEARVPVGIAGGVAALAALFLVATFYLANAKPIRTAKSILDALKISSSGQPAGKVDALIEEFRQGIALRSFGTMEVREQISQTAAFIIRDETIAGQDKAKYLDFAIQELEVQRRDFPSDVRAKAFLASLYTNAGRPADTIAVVGEALAIGPGRPQLYFLAAEAYLNANRHEDAIAQLRRAYELAPDYPEAVTNLAVILIVSGKDQEAGDLFEKHFGTRFVAQERYAQAYLQAGRFDKAAEIWERLVADSPGDARLHAALGVAYARSGRPGLGISEIQKAIELEPRFKEDGERIIEDIRAGRLR